MRSTSQPQRTATTAAIDRYALLQKKVEDLERVHQEGKKIHQVEVERLKSELSRYQAQHSEQKVLIEKQRKQSTLLEARVQELKKTAVSEQAEIKELRSKLRSLENERNRLQSQHSDISDLRTSLQSLESQRREELKQRDARVAELEKALASESTARETLATQHQALKKTIETQTKSATQGLQKLLDKSKSEAVQLAQTLAVTEEEASARQGDLLMQLEQHRRLLSQAASEFAALAAESVRKAVHTELRHQYNRLELHKAKLERKLANSEAQVVELAYLIRQVKDQNSLLSSQVRDLYEEIAFYQISNEETDTDTQSHKGLETLLAIGQHLRDDERQLAATNSQSNALISTFYRSKANELAITCSVLDRVLTISEVAFEQQTCHLSETLTSHEAIATRLESFQKEYARLQEQLTVATVERESAEASLQSLESKLSQNERDLAAVDSVHEIAMKKEKDTIQRLTAAVQKGRMAEQALRTEVDQLTNEVANLECYQEAYETLSNEVAALVARKVIAEEETIQLSQFNAEILGHHNPAQRIMYVDRIRRELAEAKNKIVQLNLQQEQTASQNEELQHELAMYKSVMVPATNKPRTNLTRVARPPLVNMAQNLNQIVPSKQPVKQEFDSTLKGTPPYEGDDFTIDELVVY